MLPLEKQCSKCKQVLPVEMFHKHCATKDGLRSECIACKQKVKEIWVRQNPIMEKTGHMITGARSRAKSKKIPFDLDLDYIRSIAPSHCPIFGVPLEWSVRKGLTPNSPSLDRIDPERGYVKGNVWIISYRANTIKNNATHEELKLVTKAVGQAIVNSLEF